VLAVCNLPNPVHLKKFKIYAGLAGNECADSVAKYQAKQVDMSHAVTGMACAGIGGNPFHNITWVAFESSTPLDTKMNRQAHLP